MLLYVDSVPPLYLRSYVKIQHLNVRQRLANFSWTNKRDLLHQKFKPLILKSRKP